MCHVAIVDMKRLSPVVGLSTPFKFGRESKVSGFGLGFGLKRKVVVRKRLKLVVRAELSKSFSFNLGLDSQVYFLSIHSLLSFLSLGFFFFSSLFSFISISSLNVLFDEMTDIESWTGVI